MNQTGKKAAMWTAVVGVLFCMSGILLLPGILILLGVPAMYKKGKKMEQENLANRINSTCPWCKGEIFADKNLGAFDCPICKSRILIKDETFQKVKISA